MSEATMNLFQLVFYGWVLIFLGMGLGKLERIATLLTEAEQRRELAEIKPQENRVSEGEPAAVGATDEEIAAVMAIMAKIVPDRKVASIRMLSK